MSTQAPFTPHIPADQKVPEFTARAVVLGIILAVVFGAANAFLGLKVGLTVSASIPAAVTSMVVLRTFFKNVSILENNMVQTIASASEALAAGVIFTIPAFAFLGEPLPLSRIALLSVLGGVLGVLFMIPLRRYLIVEEHNNLPYPEGTACAEILKAGEKGGSSGIAVLIGSIIGLGHKFCMATLHLWEESTRWVLTFYQKTVVSLEASTALMGVGFIIGPRYSALTLSGGVLGWLVIIPLIKMFGHDFIDPNTNVMIAEMSAEAIWSKYVRYIGAGAIVVGGIIGLLRATPVIIKAFGVGVKEISNTFSKSDSKESTKDRTSEDLPMSWILCGLVAIILTLWLLPGSPMNLVSVILVVIIGFFFVTVSSQIVGYVGSSVNPASGMIITTLLLITLLFVCLGWTESIYMVAAMTAGSVVGMAVCVAGDTSQDLKTGYLLGATPRLQQIGEIIGVVAAALVMGFVVSLLDQAYTLGSEKLSAPQATMMAMIVKGVMQGSIPWDLVIIGMMIGVILELTLLPVLPFAIGLYLPLSMTTPIMLGGIVALLVSKLSKNPEEDRNRGILVASGFVAGDALMGVITAMAVVAGWVSLDAQPMFGMEVSLAILLGIAIFFGWYSLASLREEEEEPAE
ncbi:MAG: putative OPT family oligopeptide transporter [Chlamydiales bacterium]|jgi:putative OPT family oligopeptide transporter